MKKATTPAPSSSSFSSFLPCIYEALSHKKYLQIPDCKNLKTWLHELKLVVFVDFSTKSPEKRLHKGVPYTLGPAQIRVHSGKKSGQQLFLSTDEYSPTVLPGSRQASTNTKHGNPQVP